MFAQTIVRWVLAIVAACWLVSSAPVVAAEAKSAPVNDKAHGDGHAEKDPTAFIDLPKRWDLSIYTIVVFLLLFSILYFLAWPNITDGLKKREELLAAEKNSAVKAKQEAEEIRAKLNAEFATANDKIRAMLEEARRDADALRVKEREAGQKEAADERARAKREIESAKDAAMQEVYQKAVELATLMSNKAIKRSLTATDHQGLVDDALSELAKK